MLAFDGLVCLGRRTVRFHGCHTGPPRAEIALPTADPSASRMCVHAPQPSCRPVSAKSTITGQELASAFGARAAASAIRTGMVGRAIRNSMRRWIAMSAVPRSSRDAVEDHAEQEAQQHAHQHDRQGDPGGVQVARKHVAAEGVGAIRSPRWSRRRRWPKAPGPRCG